MSKFKTGDKVIFKKYISDIHSMQPQTAVDLYQEQVVAEAEYTDNSWGELKIVGDDDWWDADYWELVEDWEKHQKKVDPATELELTKLQVKMLQDYRNAANYFLVQAVLFVDDSSVQRELEYFLANGKLEQFK